LGWVWGRSFIQRIFALTRVTRAIADGRMDELVVLSGQDVIRELGDAFNSMADRLVEVQAVISKKESTAVIGRVAVGICHDMTPKPPASRFRPNSAQKRCISRATSSRSAASTAT